MPARTASGRVGQAATTGPGQAALVDHPADRDQPGMIVIVFLARTSIDQPDDLVTLGDHYDEARRALLLL
jgi:hypothetical protein